MGFLYSQFFKTPPYPKGNFAGKTVIVTGSNTGLGKEAARHYARLGASKVILAVRTVAKGEDAKQEIISSTGNKNVAVWKLDMSDYASIQAFAKRAESELDRVDIFCANAGVVRSEFHELNGHEEGVAINVISTTLLLANMMPKMIETAKKYNTRPTFSIVGSAAYEHTTFPQRSAPEGQILKQLADRSIAEKYWDQQYPVSKLVILHVTRAIAAHHPASEFPVTINIINPGLCWSELARDTDGWGFYLFRLVAARTTEVGGRTVWHGGQAGVETHGKYISDCVVEEPSALVTDKAGQEAEERVAKEVLQAIEQIQPGVSKKFHV
jgi:NAD(P)-dependent dehydrogenase (short-subunit alcohol dehydrogenase family)